MSVRLLLTDEAWAEIVPILATLKSRAGSPPALSDRLFIEAVLYLARTGTPWRDLPAEDIVPVIPPKSNRTEPLDYDTALYKLREKVERFFNNLKQFRRIATRYEKLSQTFLAFIHLVAAWILIK